MPPTFRRPPDGFRFRFGGMKLNSAPDSLPIDKYSAAINVRAVQDTTVQSRPGQVLKFATGGNPITDMGAYVRQLSDDAPRYLARDNDDDIYLDTGTLVGSLAGDGIGPGAAMIPFRPGQSPTPYQYIANGSDYQKFSAPSAANAIVQSKVGIAEPQSAPDAGLAVVQYANKTGVAANYGHAGVSGATSNSSQGIAGETITQAVQDPTGVNCWSLGVSGYGGVSVFSFGQVVVLSTGGTVFVQDWINPNLSASVTIGAITYDFGTTGHCIIAPSGLGNSGAPADQSVFAPNNVPNIRRGTLLQLSGEVVFVLSVIQGPNGQIAIETQTVNNHAAGESISIIPTLIVLGTSTTPSGTISCDAILSTTSGAGIGQLTRTVNPFSGLTFGGAGPQQDDLICIFVHIGTLAAVTEIRLQFDVGDGSFTNNFFYYAMRPSPLDSAITGSATVLGDAQLVALQDAIDSSVEGSGAPITPGGFFTPIVFSIAELTRVGSNGNSIASTNAVQIWVNCTSAVQIGWGSIDIFGGGQPDVGDAGAPYLYRVRPRSSVTGAVGNPSPATRYGVSPRRTPVTVNLPLPFYDPQIDTWDIFRYGGSVTSFRYIGSTPSSNGSFTDNFDDDAAGAGDALDFDNFEPWPSLDVPFSVTATQVTGSIALVTVPVAGNILRFLPGNLVQIAGQNVYTLRKRPVLVSGTTYRLEFEESAGFATNVTAAIYEPSLANQHLPYMFGPDVNGTVFACGDPLRPGNLYFAKNYAPDSAPDTYNVEIVPPSEPLLGGEELDGLAFTASPERWWALYPQPDNPSQRYNFVKQPFPRGLAAPYGHCNDGVSIYWWAKDGIWSSTKGSLTDADLYNIFPHEGVLGKSVQYMGQTFTPPDYSRAGTFRLAYSNYYLYATYQDSTGTYRQLVLDTRRNAWCGDSYTPAVSTFLHPAQPAGTLLTNTARYDELVMGTVDGRVAVQTDNKNDLGGPIVCVLDTAEFDGGDSRAPKQWGDIFLDSTPNSANLTVTPVSLGAQVVAPISVTQSTSRVRQALGVGGVFVSDFMGLAFSWTDDFTQQSAPTLLHIWHPSFAVQPAYTQSWATFGTSFGMDGFKHIPRLLIAWVSTAPITLTITTFDGQDPAPITIPSSSGAYKKQLFMLSPNKGMLYAFQATSTAKFQLFLDDSDLYVGQWQRTGPYSIFHNLGESDAGPI